MPNTKTFADMKKPVKRPTPEEIAAFEETGRAVAPDREIAQTPAKAEIRQSANTEILEHADTEISGRVNAGSSSSAKADSQEAGSPRSQKSVESLSPIRLDTELRQPVNTEIQVSVPLVRLTIDLHESAHTRFKAACAMTKHKMVDEVRGFIEQRTVELEAEAARAR
jgi:hypothetical protein